MVLNWVWTLDVLRLLDLGRQIPNILDQKGLINQFTAILMI